MLAVWDEGDPLGNGTRGSQRTAAGPRPPACSVPRAANATKLSMRLFCDHILDPARAQAAIASATVDQQSKRPRNRGWLRFGLLRSRSGSGSKIRGVDEKSVRPGIERHVASPKFSLDRLNDAEFVRRVFMEDMQSACSGCSEEQTCFRFINVRVYSIIDGKGLENLAAVSIHDGQHFVAPADEQAAVQIGRA